MLSSRLARVQHDLQAHRRWLRTFVNAGSHNSSITVRSHEQRWRPITTILQDRQYSSRSSRPERTWRGVHRPLSGPVAFDGAVAQISELLEALSSKDLKAAEVAYSRIESKGNIPTRVLENLSAQMLQWVAVNARKSSSKQDGDMRQRMKDLAGLLAADMQRGKLQASSITNSRLLAILTTTESWGVGADFWTWLQREAGEHVSSAVYAEAILMLSLRDAPLKKLEELYEHAIEVFPNGFAAYHFSPQATIPDQDAEMLNPELPWKLLRSIQHARLMRGDSQNAYLALDASLRLLGHEPPNGNFFSTFFEERPPAEALTILNLACKAGVVFSDSQLNVLLPRLEQISRQDTVPDAILRLRATTSATFMHVGSGGNLSKSRVSTNIRRITQLMLLDNVQALEKEPKQRVADAVLDLVRKWFVLSARFSAGLEMSAFHHVIINVGGYGQAKAAISMALEDSAALGLRRTPVTMRSILHAGGSLQHPELIAQTWKELVDMQAREEKYPDTFDINTLMNACVNAGHKQMAELAIEEMDHLTAQEREDLTAALERKTPEWSVQSKDNHLSVDDVLASIANLAQDLDEFDQRTEQNAGVQNFATQSTPTYLFTPPESVHLPDAEMRKLYDALQPEPVSTAPEGEATEPTLQKGADEVTTIEAAVEMEPPAPVAKEPKLTPTQIPYRQMRYESWKAITYLLAESARNDEIYLKAVDAAIAEGRLPPPRTDVSLSPVGSTQVLGGVGLSNLQHLKEDEQFNLPAEEVSRRRAEICRLRKIDDPFKAE